MARLDIDIVDLLSEGEKYEIENVIEWLIDNYNKTLIEYMSDTVNSIAMPTEHSIQDEIWNESVMKLLKNRMGLTKEEEDIVINLSKKFI